MIPYPPKGLVLALVTPLDEQGQLDRPSLERLIERALPFCDALFVGDALVGEGLSLPNPTRLDLLRTSLEIVSGKKVLFLCPTAASPEETLGNLAALEKSRAGGPGKESLFWVDIPLWYHSNRKLPLLYQEWSLSTPSPILLYNHPSLITKLNRSLKRSNIRTAVLKRLSENEQIVGLIQAGDLNRNLHYQRAVRGRRDFRFYDGDEKNFLNGPSVSGVVSGGANILPAEWSEIVCASLKISEDPARNFLLWKQSQKLRDLAQAWRLDPARSLKFALHRLGIISQARLCADPLSSPEEIPAAMEDFLRGNFSLQFRG